jgi:hypothetical protein
MKPLFIALKEESKEWTMPCQYPGPDPTTSKFAICRLGRFWSRRKNFISKNALGYTRRCKNERRVLELFFASKKSSRLDNCGAQLSGLLGTKLVPSLSLKKLARILEPEVICDNHKLS